MFNSHFAALSWTTRQNLASPYYTIPSWPAYKCLGIELGDLLERQDSQPNQGE